MDRKNKGHLFIGLGTAWAISRMFALIRGDPLTPSVVGLLIAAALIGAGLFFANDLELALSFTKKGDEGPKDPQNYLTKYD